AATDADTAAGVDCDHARADRAAPFDTAGGISAGARGAQQHAAAGRRTAQLRASRVGRQAEALLRASRCGGQARVADGRSGRTSAGIGSGTRRAPTYAGAAART